MILLDVNVLVYAFHEDADRHEQYRSWLESSLSDGWEQIGLSESTVAGFVRIVTNRRIYSDPATAPAAAGFIEELIASGRTAWVVPNQATWNVFQRIVAADRQVAGNLVPDAWLASLAIAHGARMATADRGMARFDGLDHFDPGD